MYHVGENKNENEKGSKGKILQHHCTLVNLNSPTSRRTNTITVINNFLQIGEPYIMDNYNPKKALLSPFSNTYKAKHQSIK